MVLVSRPAAPSPSTALTRLATDRRPTAIDPAVTAPVDGGGAGRAASRPRPGVARRALAGGQAPLIGEARRESGQAVVEVWGAPATPADEGEAALRLTAAWAGLCDDAAGFADACATSPVTRRLHGEIGDVVLPRLPSVGEAVGRAIIAQLVQGAEAARSTGQLLARAGTPAPEGLRCWPSPRQVRAHPPHALRRCGISLSGARALHAAAIEDARLQRSVQQGWDPLEARLRALPGVGAWTAAETRLALGDPDAVSVGDYHLASVVGTALTGEQRRREEWSDAELLDLLEPFAGQRARVIRLCEVAAARRLVPRQPRRAPRARLSAHRYW